MNRQEMYNKAVEGLATQDFQQSKNGAICKFRGRDGRKCAVGYLVTDEQLASIKDSAGLSYYTNLDSDGLPYREPPSWKVFPLLDACLDGDAFLGNLQNAHDTGVTSEEMKRRLVSFGYKYGLTIPDVLTK